MGETERNGRATHTCTLSARETAEMTGVLEVLSFDEESVVLKTDAGELCLEGEGLRVGAFDTGSGRLSVTGNVRGLFYTERERREKKGFFGGLFG